MAGFTTFLRPIALLLAVLATTNNLANAQCNNVQIVFARGSTEPQGLGICGAPLVSAIKSALPGKTVGSYAVVYAADAAQLSAGPGATVMTNYIKSYAAQCPNAVFVIGGYSQGASVTDIAIGIKTSLGSGEVIPTSLASRIKAVVTFGNPLGLFGKTLAQASPTYAAKSIEYCLTGDPVCGGGLIPAVHLLYPSRSVPEAARRAAALVSSGSRNLRSDGDEN
jgi:cutinase